MQSHLPAADRRAVVFATTADGLRLPVIDVTHPAFAIADDPASLAASVGRAIEGAAPGIRVTRVTDMRARVDLAVSVQRLAAELASFAGAMVLANRGVIARAAAEQRLEFVDSVGHRARRRRWSHQPSV